MSKNYDNREKLVGAVLKREQLRQLALCKSTSCSSISDDISSFDDEAARKINAIVSLYYDVTDDAAIWGMFLLPHPGPDTSSRLVPGNVVFLPVEAKEFVIQTEGSPTKYLPYSLRLESSFETAEINSVSPVEIQGKIRTRLLTSKTIYICKLEYKPSKTLGIAKAMNRYVNEREGGRERAISRGDGWIEFQIGSFYVDDGDEQEVETHILETSSRWKGGLFIEGIELRPIVNVKQL